MRTIAIPTTRRRSGSCATPCGRANSPARLFAFIVHGEPLPRTPELRVALSTEEVEVRAKRAALRMHQAGVSPVHDYLESRFGKAEELFWEFPAR